MTNLISPEATISYPTLFTPRLPPNAKPADEPKFSASFLFTEAATKTPAFAALQKAALEAAAEKFGAKNAAALAKKAFISDERVPEGYAVMIRSSSKQKPGVVSRYAGANGKPTPIEDPTEVYAGALVRASLRPFAYENSGNKGVSFGLGNVQKLADGERIDGRKKAEDEFEASESAPAELAGAGGNLMDLVS